MQWKGLMIVLTGLSVLCATGCGTTRSASRAESLEFKGESLETREARDSLREEVCQHLNENLEEHEVITEMVIPISLGATDSLTIPLSHFVTAPLNRGAVVRVTERTRTKFQVSSSKFQDSKVAVRKEVVRDTVYVERRDSVLVQESRNYGSTESQSDKTAWHTALRWVFWIIVAIGGLIGIIKFRV